MMLPYAGHQWEVREERLSQMGVWLGNTAVPEGASQRGGECCSEVEQYGTWDMG